MSLLYYSVCTMAVLALCTEIAIVSDRSGSSAN